MIVMGGIIGSGIFMNPSVVALQVHTPFLILGAWVLGGLFALAAAFIWAELAALRPDVGGQYAYLREAFHPGVAFLYGWVLLLVIQTGGMAAVAVTFARYFVELTHLPIAYAYLAAIVLATLTVINCLGVRAGSTVQSILMVLKIRRDCDVSRVRVFIRAVEATNPSELLDRPPSVDLLTAFGAALVPVIFAYGGWQTATFHRRRDQRAAQEPAARIDTRRHRRRLCFILQRTWSTSACSERPASPHLPRPRQT